MQLFRMREYVRMGTPSEVMAFRQDWMERGTKLMEEVGLPSRSMSPTTRSSAAPDACTRTTSVARTSSLNC